MKTALPTAICTLLTTGFLGCSSTESETLTGAGVGDAHIELAEVTSEETAPGHMVLLVDPRPGPSL